MNSWRLLLTVCESSISSDKSAVRWKTLPRQKRQSMSSNEGILSRFMIPAMNLAQRKIKQNWVIYIEQQSE